MSSSAEWSTRWNTGDVIDGLYQLTRIVGHGGMGVVHLATQATLGRHVAVKTMRSGAGDIDATLRILREAWVTGALEHPNVVPIYDVGVDATGNPVIVMKRIETAAHAVATYYGNFPVPRTRIFVVPVADQSGVVQGTTWGDAHRAQIRGRRLDQAGMNVDRVRRRSASTSRGRARSA